MTDADQLVVTGLTRRYGQGATATAALQGVSLRVERGEMVAVVGPSGSGKTTLLNCIAGLDRPDDGTVSVFGRDVTALDYEEAVEWRRASVAIVFQADGLVDHLSAAENIDIVLRLRGVERSERRDRVAEALDDVGLGELADHRPAELSGGQRLRVGLARALAARPALLIADEPTGQLDSATADRVLHELRAVTEAQGITVIMATHDPAAEAIADRAVRLVDGRISDGRIAGGGE